MSIIAFYLNHFIILLCFSLQSSLEADVEALVIQLLDADLSPFNRSSCLQRGNQAQYAKSFQ